MWGDIAYYTPLSEKVRGRFSRVSNLIAPMPETDSAYHSLLEAPLNLETLG